jgi:hypothetical protein
MKRERLDDFTERAIRSTEAGKLIPPIVYLPRRLRGQKVRLTEDNLRYTVDPPTVTETHVAIAGADPVGFLIAIMHGQPIPEFRIARDGAIDVFYAVPEFETRTRAALPRGEATAEPDPLQGVAGQPRRAARVRRHDRPRRGPRARRRQQRHGDCS